MIRGRLQVGDGFRALWRVSGWFASVFVCLTLVAAEPPAIDEAADPAHAEKMARGLEIYQQQVKSILVERCVKCHGGEATEGKLDITDRKLLLKGGESGPAIIPGKAKESLLYRLVTHQDEPKMPQEENKLPDEQIAALTKWIDNLAPYDGPLIGEEERGSAWTERKIALSAREHWAFQPLRPVDPPAVKNSDWAITPLDRFVLSKLETAGLEPSGAVERRRYIRRAYFDLLGLPPTPEAVQRFMDDKAPGAHQRVIDALLEQPGYGERWARHWLDLVRFAESHGFEHDYDRPTAFHYRDFVIEALNRDLPYDTFVKWQLAGDEYAPDDRLALMATGYLAAGVHSTQITANEAERHRYDELDDILANVGTSMLGLTLGCARCHDHKFDPLPMGDYYRMLSTFTTTVRSEVELNFDEAGYRQLKAAFDAQHAPLVQELERFEREELSARLANWETQRTGLPAEIPWLILEPSEIKSLGEAKFQPLGDGSYRVEGNNHHFDRYTFTIPIEQTGITHLRLEALADPSMVRGGPGRAENGNFALTDIAIEAVSKSDPNQKQTVKLKNARATFEQPGLPVGATIDADSKSAWAVDPEFGKDHAAAFELETPVGYAGGSILTIVLRFDNNYKHSIGRPRLSVATLPQPPDLTAPAIAAEIPRILAQPAAQRTEPEQQKLLRWYRTLDEQWQARNRVVAEHLIKQPQPATQKVLVSSEGLPPLRLHTQGADFLPETHFLRRGDPNQKAGVAAPGFLQVLLPAGVSSDRWRAEPPAGGRTSHRRRAFAEWITDVDQGAGRLLARVIVNRLWQHHLGRGIVATASDFGTRGERPTDPELLDFLASELIAGGWRLKPIHKLIMTSAVYRQDSAPTPGNPARDPEEKLPWRWRSRRLEAEVIRDAILSLSGQMETRLYGPGTLDEASRRRSIYFTVKRSRLLPMMQVFDAPDALSGIGERPTTTVAPQALMLINNPHVRGSARGFATSITAAVSAAQPTGADVSAPIRRAYVAALAREPSEAELTEGRAFLQSQTASYTAAGKGDAAQLALTDLCQVLFCLNEFVYID